MALNRTSPYQRLICRSCIHLLSPTSIPLVIRTLPSTFSQLRQKSTSTKGPDSITVRLLKDIAGYGKKGLLPLLRPSHLYPFRHPNMSFFCSDRFLRAHLKRFDAQHLAQIQQSDVRHCAGTTISQSKQHARRSRRFVRVGG